MKTAVAQVARAIALVILAAAAVAAFRLSEPLVAVVTAAGAIGLLATFIDTLPARKPKAPARTASVKDIVPFVDSIPPYAYSWEVVGFQSNVMERLAAGDHSTVDRHYFR
jgi:hypothetical protein